MIIEMVTMIRDLYVVLHEPTLLFPVASFPGGNLSM